MAVHWTQKERIEMLHVARQISSLTSTIKARHVHALWDSNHNNRSIDAIYNELNRCKKAIECLWSDSDNNSKTLNKVNVRRSAMRFVGFPFLGPTEITLARIEFLEGPSRGPARGGSSSGDGTVFLPRVMDHPTTPVEKLFYLIAEDRYRWFGDYRNREPILKNMAEAYWGSLSPKQTDMVEDLYSIYIMRFPIK